ncbi:MAG: SMP-30/gluconolactonase/LRE family protein [Acidimicrobiaceae bacterium]|nr:SMP-30/gluconolactonase/LRE family protein [Acidimicrobiaceae bacterium]
MVAIIDPTPELDELIDPQAEFELLGSGFTFTEGPAWNNAGGYLEFSDIPGDARWRWSRAKGMELVMRPNFKGNGMVFEPDGSLLICEQVTSTLIRVKPNGDRQVAAYHYQGKYLNSPNDVITRSDGSIYFTDPNYGRWPAAVGVGRECDLDFQGVYRVPPGGGDCELVVAKDEFEQPNGLCFSPDERLLYINDRQDVKVFDVAADGSLGPARVVCTNMGSQGGPASGNPDGMKCDERGNVWCTARHGIWVLDPGGKLLGIIRTPEVAGNLVWGGPDLRSLFVPTTTTVHVIETKVAAAPLPCH